MGDSPTSKALLSNITQENERVWEKQKVIHNRTMVIREEGEGSVWEHIQEIRMGVQADYRKTWIIDPTSNWHQVL